MSRLENSVKNIVLSFANSVLSSILGLVSRTVFIFVLGTEYLGLSGLLSNVLGFLSISEMGIATAIGFSLYKPLAEKDYKSISSLMSVYRKAYSIIGIFVLISGIGLYGFLDFFIPSLQQPDGTTFAYFAFLMNIVIGYFLSYKTTLLSSDNQTFRLVPINVSMNVVQTITQIGVLLLFKNYVAYLGVQIVCSVIIMFLQNRFITERYKEVDFYSKDELSSSQKNELKKNIGGLIIAKIGDYLVNSTDNLIITKLVSLSATGIYSNYLLIRNMVNGYIGTLFAGVTAGMGNIVAVESDERKKQVFDTMMFCSYFIYSFEAVCFICLFNPFIGNIWLDKKFLFDSFTVAIIVINNYLTGLRMPLIIMKSAAGTYMEDSWIPFAFAGINLVASVVLVKWMGVSGVFLGTIIGSLLTADWYRPIIIYHKVFHTSVKEYYKKYLLYVFLGCVYMALAYCLCSLVNISSVVLDFLCKTIIAIGIPLVLNVLIFYRTKEFDNIREMFNRILRSVKAKINYLVKRRGE